ncbi:MAG: hypothetical protein OXH86_01375 [Acidimicrobiaceae bacterium]|nr:hypothetical protein [Acidimicrobiaceae bacterium]
MRTRGTFEVPDDGDNRPAWLQFDTVAAAPRSRFKNGPAALAEIPGDVLHLVVATRALDRHGPRPAEVSRRAAFGWLFRRWNANPWIGCAHRLGRYVLVLAALALAGTLGSSWNVVQVAVLIALPAIALVMLLGVLASPVLISVRISRDDAVSTQREIRREQGAEPAGTDELLPTHLVPKAHPPRWLGAASHSQSVGRKLNGNDVASGGRRLWKRVGYKWRHAGHNRRRVARAWRERRERRRAKRPRPADPAA